jgi:hypothetical protein
MPKLPRRFPDGSKYIVEACGAVVKRYVELPTGRRIRLRSRRAQECKCLEGSISIAPSKEVDSPIFDRRVFA